MKKVEMTIIHLRFAIDLGLSRATATRRSV